MTSRNADYAAIQLAYSSLLFKPISNTPTNVLHIDGNSMHVGDGYFTREVKIIIVREKKSKKALDREVKYFIYRKETFGEA